MTAPDGTRPLSAEHLRDYGVTRGYTICKRRVVGLPGDDTVNFSLLFAGAIFLGVVGCSHDKATPAVRSTTGGETNKATSPSTGTGGTNAPPGGATNAPTDGGTK